MPAHLDGLVVVPVHVAHEEVVDGHVHDVEQPPALVVRLHLAHDLAVGLVRLPVGLAPLVVRPPPRVPPRLPRGDRLNEGIFSTKYSLLNLIIIYRALQISLGEQRKG